MCGIGGIFGSDEAPPICRRRVDAMLRAMKHRGPDGEGSMALGGGHVGMVRLALVDLHPRGQQPLHAADGRVSIVFNGEMYNFREEKQRLETKGHVFHTGTDTEVVLALFLEGGVESFQKIRGMFAFAIVDRRGRADDAPPDVILCRGPHGMKPLYVADPAGGRGTVFSSELRALLASGLVVRELDLLAVDDFLRFGFVIQPRTILRGVRMVEAGTVEIHRPGAAVETRRWWRWPTPALRRRTFRDAAEELRAILEESIRLHALADAPVGAFLSGGVDSSAIVAMMRPHLPRLRTFTLRFPERPGEDEAEAALRTAGRLGCDADVVDVLDEAVEHDVRAFIGCLDQPSTDGFNTWLVSRAAGGKVKAVLSGVGGDEWFAGYPVAGRMLALASTTRGRVAAASGRLAMRLRAVPAHALGGRIGKARARGSTTALWCHAHTVFDEDGVQALGGRERGQQQRLQAHCAHDVGDWEALSPLQQCAVLDVRGYMMCQLLRDSDATSMAHSLELRAPFVDVEVARFALSCPDDYKLRADDPSHPKRILVEAVRDCLPDEVARRDKRGFTLPYQGWLQGPLRDLLLETCHPSEVRRRGLLDPFAVGQLFEQAERGDSHAIYPRLWALLTLEQWCRSVLDGPPPAEAAVV